MNQLESSRFGGKCSVWECENAALAASLCGKHLPSNPAFQDGAVPPSSDASSRQPGGGVKHTAKRSRGFSVRRSGGPTPVKAEPRREAAESRNSTLFPPVNRKDGYTPRDGQPGSYVQPCASPISGQTPFQPPISTQGDSFIVNTIIFNHNHQSGLSSTIQRPLPNSNLNIPSANGNGSVANYHYRPQDNLDINRVSKTISGQDGQALSNQTNGHTVISSCLDSMSPRLSNPPNEPFHPVSTNLHEPNTSVRVEHAHFVQVHSDILLESSSKRKRDLTNLEKVGSGPYLTEQSRRPAQIENVYQIQHHPDKMGVGMSTSPRKRMQGSVTQKRRESSIPISKLISAENISPKMPRVSKRIGSPEEGAKNLPENLAADREIRQASEPNLRNSRGASIAPIMETMGSKESKSWLVSEDRQYTRAAFSVDSYPELSLDFPEPPQHPPTLAAKDPRGQEPLPDLSKSQSMAPTTPRKDMSMVNRVTPPPRITVEERRRARIRNFDSAAFDAMIYAQTSMRPPQGVVVPANSRPKTPIFSHEDERLYLHVNPSIHMLHNRSEEWHREKALEIQARGGRKAWFGKAIERERWLREKEKAEEEKQTKALAAGSTPMRPEPQPWTYNRVMDFGDVARKDLPEDVLQNPAWERACAWHRENKAKNLLRQRAAKDWNQQAWDHLRNVMEGVQSASKRPS